MVIKPDSVLLGMIRGGFIIFVDRWVTANQMQTILLWWERSVKEFPFIQRKGVLTPADVWQDFAFLNHSFCILSV